MTDPDFHGGHYYEKGVVPTRGLRIARMIGHITYLSGEAMAEKFGRALRRGDAGLRLRRRLRDRVLPALPGRQVLDLLRRQHLPAHHQGARLLRPGGGLRRRPVGGAGARQGARSWWSSFKSDWRFTPARSREMVRALLDNRRIVSYLEIDAPGGHDAFLLEDARYHARAARLLRQHRAMTTRLRPDLAAIVQWVPRARAVLDLGCGDGALLRTCGRSARRRATASRSTTTSVLACVGERRQRAAGRPRERPLAVRRPLVRLRDPLADPAGDPPHRSSCCARCCASAARRSSASRTSATGARACRSRSAACRCRRRCPTSGTRRRTCTTAPSRDFEDLCRRLGVRISERLALHEGTAGDRAAQPPRQRRRLPLHRRLKRACVQWRVFEALEGHARPARRRRALLPDPARLPSHRRWSWSGGCTSTPARATRRLQPHPRGHEQRAALADRRAGAGLRGGALRRSSYGLWLERRWAEVARRAERLHLRAGGTLRAHARRQLDQGGCLAL